MVQAVHTRCRHLCAMFEINVFAGTKYCPPVLETVSIVSPLGTSVIFQCSVSPPASALQPDMVPLQVKFVYVRIHLVSAGTPPSEWGLSTS
jgi:hypothetical protein